MLAKELKDIDEALLQAVCKEQWRESQTLEFKRDLPGVDDKSKQEFSKDICAMANGGGGDAVYGIKEASGHAADLAPIAAANNPVDATKRRLGQILDGGIEPRVEGLLMHPVVLASGDYVLAIRVPASFQRPHRSRFQAHWQWPVRVDSRVEYLTYDQIRDAFDRGATITERVRRFRDERITGVLAGTMARPLQAGPRCVVHLLPLASFSGKSAIDLQALYYGQFPQFSFPDWGGAGRSFNLDGLLVHPGAKAAHIVYSQVFRNGCLESARFVGALLARDDEDKTNIPSGVVAGFVRQALEKFCQAAADWGIGGPAIASVALLDVGGWRLAYDPKHWLTQRNPSDRPNLILPEYWIEQVGSVHNIDEVAQPMLDTLFQCFDMERCPFYSQAGAWNAGW
jgi:hypothetical protein